MTTSSSIHSNALNFLSFVETGVDPRTGQYTCGLSLPELKGNDLGGPGVPLRLSYSPLNIRDSGFGKGWTLQQSQYDTASKVVALASGETFKVTSTSSGGDGQLLMKEQKIAAFRLFDLNNGRFRVVHKSGLVEELATASGDAVALPDVQYSPQGHSVTFSYTTFASGRLLKGIADGAGRRLLDIARSGTSVNVRLHPDTAHEALFRLVLEGSDSRVSRIELPTTEAASWRFAYETQSSLLCISRVEGPLGGREILEYDTTPHQFPGTSGRTLPRVRRHLHEPGAGQPAIDTRYGYSTNNFLGRNAPGLVWEDNGLDNLYKVLAAYAYETTEQLWDAANSNAKRTITRTFNRFHLIGEELTEQGDAVKRVRTHYYADDNPNLTFDQQPAQCQLAKTVTSTWYRKSSSGQTRSEVVTSEYDVHGNPTLQVQANGIREASEYYPAAGASGCPPDPHGFVRYLKQATVTPAQADFGDAPVLRTEHRYVQQPGLSGSAWPWVALDSETLIHVNGGNAQLQTTTYRYLNDPLDTLLHGRKSSTAVTLNRKTTSTGYAYSKTIGLRAAEPVLRTVETLTTDFDAVSKSITLEHSLLSGHSLLERDDNDVEIAYRYDKLGRVIEETVAPGSDVEARREYRFVLVNQATAQASQTAIDVKGTHTRTVMDGLQREIETWRQDVDGDPVNKPFRQTGSARYNAFGQLAQRTAFDWLGRENLALDSHSTYDEWGEEASVTGPGGVTEYTHSDPVALTVETWRDGMGKTVTHNNLFEKPDKVERFDLAGGALSRYEYFYDGLGRTSHEYDELQQFRFYQYDAFDRMTLSGLPDSAQVERRYAEHSAEDLPVWIGVNGVVLGEQQFDGLERMYRSVTGGRVREFAFKGGQQQPDSVTTASGQVIEYEYNPQLGEEPTQRRLQGVTADYEYDKDNARLLFSRENNQSLDCSYYSTGELKTERRIIAGQTHDMAYEYSLRGRLLSYTDVLGQQQRYHYDASGRLGSTSLGQTETHFSYNASGLTSRILTEDKAERHSVRIDLKYDDFGRETLRTFTFDDGVVQTLEQHYNARDALVQRTLRKDTTVLRDETFAYDKRGRLEDYTCSGSELPLDAWGKPIRQQVFTFDALDNITRVRTVFPGGENLATYLFEGQDPTQLSAVRNSHADYPALISLDYDADGNLIRDEQGRSLTYDALGRLQAVDEDGEGGTLYRYDAQDVLSGSVDGEGDELRFYREGELASQIRDGVQRSFFRGDEHVLAELVSGADTPPLLLATDVKKTPLAERDSGTRALAYSAHGFRSASDAVGLTGFNGECLERSGVYLLGSYRAYNPALMILHSPDSWSPFGDGGLNGYAYCLGDPVNYVDPTGHMPWWVGLVAGVLAVVLTAGLAAPLAAVAGVSAVTAAAIGGVATKVALVATGASLGSGVASMFVKDEGLKSALGLVSFATGILAGAAGGLAAGVKAGASMAPRLSRSLGGSSQSKVSSGSWRPGPEHGLPEESGSIVSRPSTTSSQWQADEAAAEAIYQRAKQPVPPSVYRGGNYNNVPGLTGQGKETGVISSNVRHFLNRKDSIRRNNAY